jgi:hypothetical protein
MIEGKPIPDRHLATSGKDETGRIGFKVGENERGLLARSFIEYGAENDTMFRTEFRYKNPIAIVLIIDHRYQDAALKYASLVIDAIKGLSQSVVEEKIRLKCILVLVNKNDLWADNAHEIQKHMREYQTNAVGKQMMEVVKYKPRCRIIFKPSCLIDTQLKQYTVDALKELADALRG